jgi:hypothetical protein
MTVEPPKADPLAVSDADVTPRSREELIPNVMEMRDCSDGEAEQYILDTGRGQVERELRARWTTS